LSISPVSCPQGPPFEPLELYAAAIDTSDYVARVAPVARRLVPEEGELLAAHLASRATPDAAGVRLDIPRKSAVLVWGKP
jgi:hypothetical protein